VERLAVDEERRRAARAERVALGQLVIDLLGLNLPDSSAALNLPTSRPSSAGVLLEAVLIERLLVGKQLVVHLPELALLVRGQAASAAMWALLWKGSGSCLKAIRTSPSKFLRILFEGLHHPRAERTLEVRVLDDGDLGGLRANRRAVANRNLEHDARVRQLELGRLRLLLGRLLGRGLLLAVLDERGVELLGLDARLEQLARRGQLFVDNLREVLVRLRARQRPPVDEERRRAARAELGGLGLVALDLLVVLGLRSGPGRT
jgi:hypothetical protein